MMRYLNEALAKGPVQATIMVIGGNAQVSLKVEIIEADDIGILCRTKGMLGGMSEPLLRPWSCIAGVNFGW